MLADPSKALCFAQFYKHPTWLSADNFNCACRVFAGWQFRPNDTYWHEHSCKCGTKMVRVEKDIGSTWDVLVNYTAHWNRQKVCLGKMWATSNETYQAEQKFRCKKYGTHGTMPQPSTLANLADLSGDSLNGGFANLPAWAVVLLVSLLVAIVGLTIAGFVFARRNRLLVYRTVNVATPTKSTSAGRRRASAPAGPADVASALALEPSKRSAMSPNTATANRQKTRERSVSLKRPARFGTT